MSAMSALGQKQTCAVRRSMSALPPKADIRQTDDLCWALAGNSELGFDESGEGKNLRPYPLHSDLFQNRLKLLAKLIKGRSRLPNVDHAPAARHWSCNVREYPLDRPVGEPLSAPFQHHLDALFVFRPGRRTAKFKKDSDRHGVSPGLSLKAYQGIVVMSAKGSEADMCVAISDVRFTPNGDRESGHPHKVMSALPPKADMCSARAHVCYGPEADIALLV
jgi:hypothetical protein